MDLGQLDSFVFGTCLSLPPKDYFISANIASVLFAIFLIVIGIRIITHQLRWWWSTVILPLAVGIFLTSFQSKSGDSCGSSQSFFSFDLFPWNHDAFSDIPFLPWIFIVGLLLASGTAVLLWLLLRFADRRADIVQK